MEFPKQLPFLYLKFNKIPRHVIPRRHFQTCSAKVLCMSDSSKKLDRSGDKLKGLADVDKIKKGFFDSKERLSQAISSWWSKSSTKSSSSDTEEWYSKKVSFWMKRYEDFVGLTEVKASQAKVVVCERQFINMQEVRRAAQVQIRDVQEKIKQIHAELEKTYRGEDRYLTLVTQEHQILKKERVLLDEFHAHERREREAFSELSNAVRDSHEKERAQAEKTKYWSVIGSVVGTCLGILGTTINNRLRMRELRDLVSKSASGEKLLSVTDELEKDLEKHENRLKDLVTQVQHAITDSKLSLGKIGEMREISEKLRSASEKLSSSDLENKTGILLKRSDELQKLMTSQQKHVQNFFAELSNQMKKQTGMLEASLSSALISLDSIMATTPDRDKYLKQSFDNIYHNQSNIVTLLNERNRYTDDKVKEVLSVLTGLQTAAAARKDKEQALLKNLDESLIDRIEDALENHETRLKTTTLLSGIAIAFVTPALVYAFNKLW